MKSLPRILVLGLVVAGAVAGCAVVVRGKPTVNIAQLLGATPKTIAILPFHNESGQPIVEGIARDALFYALAERGFQLLALRAIDETMNDRVVSNSLRRPNGSLDVQAAGRAFGADAVAVGRIVRAKSLHLGIVEWVRLGIQVWLIDVRSQRVIWSDTASAFVRVFDPTRRPRALTPAERRQAPLLRLCRAFDAAIDRMARALPSVAAATKPSSLTLRRVQVRAARPILSTGDTIEILAEGTPGCTARAVLGTLGTAVVLEQSGGKATGIYRGSYTIQPGDRSSYCRATVVLESGADRCERIVEAKAGFLVDASSPAPPTQLAAEAHPDGVVLTWEPPSSADVTHYLVFRSDTTTAGVRLLAHPTDTTYTDRIGDERTARLPHHWVYFVKAADFAGNASSPSAELAFDLPPRGPSTVGGIIQGEVRWTAYGGPYRLALDVDVVPGARLIMEPGAEIEIPPGMEITVRGTVEAIGRVNDPIRVIGVQASRGFHLTHPQAVLRAAHIEISGAQRSAIEVADGECYLEEVTLSNSRVGLNARNAQRLALSHSTIRGNWYGVVAGPHCEIRNCDLLYNEVGLRVASDDIMLERCLFDNTRLDLEKVGDKPLAADGHTFWTADPSELYRHLFGNIVCRTVRVRRWLLRGERTVQFEPVAAYLAQADAAAFDYRWERAVRAYEAALLQERNRDVVEKVLKMYKQIVEVEGPAALERETEFCLSAIAVYPHDLKLLHHLAALFSRQNNTRMAREVYTRILKIVPSDEIARRYLAAAPSSP